MKKGNLLVVVASVLAAGCHAPTAELTPRYLLLDLDGSFAAGSGSSNTRTDWKRLGLDEDSGALSPRADLRSGPVHLTVDAARGRYAGNGFADGQIDLEGVTIASSTAVTSELDVDIWRATATFDLFPTDFAEIGVGFGLAAFDAHATIVDTLSSSRATTDEIVPVPYGALRLGLDWGAIELEGLVALLSLEVGDAEAKYFDADIAARWFVLGGKDRARVALAIGYRWIDLDLEYDDGADRVDIDVELSGPYLGATIAF